MKKTLFWILFSGLLSGTAAFAAPKETVSGVYFGSSWFPSYSQSNTGLAALGGNTSDTNSLSSESGISYEARNTLGFRFATFAFVGGTYNLASAPLKRSVSASATSLDRTQSASEYGPTIGGFYGNFRILGTYFLTGTKKRTEKQVSNDGTTAVDVTYENKDGKGYQIELGYSIPLSRVFRIGPTLIYRKISYEKQTLQNRVDPTANYTDRPFNTKATEAGVLPMVSFILQF